MYTVHETDFRVKAPPTPVMPFGKFKGTPLAELSDDYLLWLGCLDDLRQPLLGAVLREMGRRLAERPAADMVTQP